MKKIVFIISLLMLSLNMVAQNNADAILNKLVDNISKNSPVHFEAKCNIKNNDLDINAEFPVSLYMDTNRYNIEADILNIINTGTETYNINTEIKEITIFTNDDEDDITSNPFMLIFKHKDFVNAEVISHSDNKYVIKLKPLTEELFKDAEITITKTDKSEYTPSVLKIKDDNNTEYLYIITKCNKNITNLDIFKINESKYNNYTIIDMR